VIHWTEELAVQAQQVGQNKRAEHIRDQLEQFFLPVYQGLWNDQAEWRIILGVREEQGTLEHRLARYYEEAVIIPNHKQTVEIIDSKFPFVDMDEHLLRLLQQYKKDVGEYIALRRIGEQTLFAVEKSGDDWWHQELFDAIKARIERLKKEYQA
jgi:hypothetical protein